jgi:hypothetical protein
MLQKNLDTLREWAVENGKKINPGKSKTTKFTRTLVKKYLGYSLGVQKNPEGSNCKFNHLWRYSPFRALASITRRLHSSLFATLLLHPLIPSSCSASL